MLAVVNRISIEEIGPAGMRDNLIAAFNCKGGVIAAVRVRVPEAGTPSDSISETNQTKVDEFLLHLSQVYTRLTSSQEKQIMANVPLTKVHRHRRKTSTSTTSAESNWDRLKTATLARAHTQSNLHRLADDKDNPM